MKETQIQEKVKLTQLDIRMVVSILICILTSTLLSNLNIKFTYGAIHLEIIQKMTSAIACLLCCQESVPISKKAGVNRIIITIIGGMVGIVVIVLDNIVENQWVMALMIAVGIGLTLLLCKMSKVPYINARIGGVTFILVTCTMQSFGRVYYAWFRLLSTIYGGCCDSGDMDLGEAKFGQTEPIVHYSSHPKASWGQKTF